ncbi:MAG: hypothetical protein NC131_08415 [Roseburia sp.]|nr:hypothetical protein [Roseburia sp.]
MRKFNRVLAFALGVGIVAGGVAALSGCSNDNGDGLTQEQVESMVKDETIWNQAFDDLDYTNFTLKIHYETSDGDLIDNFAKITPDGIYCKTDGVDKNDYGISVKLIYAGQIVSGVYAVKNANETYTTYLSDGTKWWLSEDTTDSDILTLKNQLVLRVSYANYYDLFNFDEKTLIYHYDGVIDVEAQGSEGESIGTLACTDITVKAASGKIVSVKSKYSVKDGGEEAGEVLNASFEYYDIGTTEVKVPKDVIDEATANAD